MKSEKENSAKPKISEPKKVAAGLSAVVNSTKVTLKKAGARRGAKLLLHLNQKGGIDCNSCAWADPEGERTHAEFCESGAKAIADEATTKRVTPEFFAEHSVAELLGKSYQLFVRQFGTNNLPDCSNMCHESTSVALAESIGLGKATIRLSDLEDTDLIIIIGQNPGTCAPRMMSSLKKAKERGAKIIAVNPLPEAGLLNFADPNPEHYDSFLKYPFALVSNQATPLADLYLPIRIGGDMAFLKGVMKILLEKEKKSPTPVFDYEFINAKTEGFQDFVANLETIEWETILEQTGFSIEQIAEVAEMFLASKRVITCWAMGVTQHKHSVAAIQDIVNLHLLRGQIGRQGAGLCPVRGHSNVQGDRTMGVWEKMRPDFRQKLEKEFHFKTPEKDGYTTVEAIEAMHARRAKFFFAMGGNFLSATPDTNYTAEALRNCNLTAQVITKLNRTALVTGKKSLILPCLGRTEKDLTGGKEQFITTENTMLNVQMSRGILEPASEHLRSETWIVGKLAQAVLKNKMTIDWERMINDYDRIRDAIAKVVPGCEAYNTKVRHDGGFYLPNPPREGAFPTASGKAKFTAAPLEKIELQPDELLMTTVRAHDQFNTAVYEENDRYRGISGSRRVILMNATDIAERGLKQGDAVDITSHFQNETRRIENFTIVAYPIPPKCAATYFPEANALIPVSSYADRSKCPTSKATIITVSVNGQYRLR
jgi:molybdopterin-dependent oxidoreductase alpha subunit